MTTEISIRNPKPLQTVGKQTLSIEVKTKDSETLFLLIPVGNAVGDLLTQQEFERASWKIAKADPAKKEQPDARLGTRNIDQNKGRAPITRRYRSTEANFFVVIENFTPAKAAKSINLEIWDNREKLAGTTVAVNDASPKIEEFVSTTYNFERGKGATLSWVIKPAGPHRLQWLDHKQMVYSGDKEQGETTVADAGTYQLEAMSGDTVADTRSITLYSFGKTEAESIYCGPTRDIPPGALACAEILGIYQHKGKLYAVVRDSAAADSASIWRTEYGFERKDWLRLAPKQGAPVSIPVDAASSPGVVFDDKLYFMGGSSFDADGPASDVGYFHFESVTWVDQDIVAEAWPKPRPEDQDRPAAPFPKARMGHGLLASPDGQRLWVIGGYNGDGGALNDIWVYDKLTQTWEQRAAPPWEPRCLFGATFCGPRLWIAGGFDSPGGYPTYDDIWYCDISKEYEWKKLDASLIIAPDNKIRQYRGCALAPMGDQIYAFASYDEVDQHGQNKVFRIYPSGSSRWRVEEVTGVTSDWVTSKDLVPLDCYRLDATVFGGAIFVRRLARAAAKDNSLRYLVLV